MKKIIVALVVLFTGLTNPAAQESKAIGIETARTSLIFSVNKNGRVYQSYFGSKLSATDVAALPDGKHEAYVAGGLDDSFEPAIQLTHADGNPSLELVYQNTTVDKKETNVTLTVIHLKDKQYPVNVDLYYEAYFKENIIKAWTTIRHSERANIVLRNYASMMLHFDAHKYFLTQFHGDWAKEMGLQESELTAGIKTIDSKLGTRATKFESPSFLLSLSKPSDEINGEVVLSTLGWTGNFKLSFEIDNLGSLRVISGINNYASDYPLKPGEVFTTPEALFTYSTEGRGAASRSMQSWGRKYGVLDGEQSRYVLLNNWEATGFKFNDTLLVKLFDDARILGADLFLLDDGWFGNKYPRSDARGGLGDWQETATKLPGGVDYLVKEATKRDIKFGIWIEPEMVNPRSELYEKHPDWIIKLSNRDENYQRNQLVLDLTNPSVQDFVYGVVDNLITKNPALAYMKWDCNRTMTNIYSPYLKSEQSKLYVAYVKGFYAVLERLRKKYPHFPVMMCSGGGGRADYGAMKYFTEFWPSDNTDGLERVYIQWGYSYFFPSIVLSSHVTSWGKQSLKFRTDVAMMDKLGYDIDVRHFTPQELAFSQTAVKNFKRLSPTIWKGDQYRLISPYEENRAVLMYVDSVKNKAVLFNYNLDTRFAENMQAVRLQGLDPLKKYKVEEVNMMPGEKSKLPQNGKTYSGDYLMKIGLTLTVGRVAQTSSNVLEITAQ